MNRSLLILAGTVAFFSSCGNDKNKSEVVSQRHIHKYGYHVAPKEWEENDYPGQIITSFRNGQTVTETYADTLLHGPKTITYEHSQTVHIKEIYQKGILTKRTIYSIRGVPEKETVFKTPSHLYVTSWFSSGSPREKEEYIDGKLINGQYFSIANEIDSCVENGTGEKTFRNSSGDIIYKNVYTNYDIDYKETYHPNNTPHIITSYKNGKLHGEKKEFALSGEPLSVENYANGLKDGVCVFFQNGYKYKETTYSDGKKHGIEKLFIDGETLSEESEYKDGLRHGSSVVYCDGVGRTYWYFNNQRVSKNVFDQYEQRDNMIISAQ